MGWHNEITSQRSPGPAPGSRGEGRARVRESQGRGKEEERRRRRDRKDRGVDQCLDQDRRLRRGGVENDQTMQRGRDHGRAAGRREYGSKATALPPRAGENPHPKDAPEKPPGRKPPRGGPKDPPPAR